jgi:hypothetical protein
VVKLLYTVATASVQLPTPAAEQMTLADTAARQLLAYRNTPDGVTEAAWQLARRDVETVVPAQTTPGRRARARRF